ncbi:hypothetical protein MTYM_01947 [Methylococcales bacterium]|nr:hypothetical protein MTYM_01947 [Methylococcales bacterium]
MTKYILILAVLVGGIVFAKTYLTHTENRLNAEITTAVKPSAQDSSQHFTAEDLAKIGCRVAPELGKFSQVDFPLLGTVKFYALRSETGCKVDLISEISSAKENDEGSWAGVRAGASVTARKRGFELESEEGSLGEYSEIQHFSQNGADKGFTYTIQSKGFLHSITIFSDEVTLDDRLESVIAAKF